MLEEVEGKGGGKKSKEKGNKKEGGGELGDILIRVEEDEERDNL